MDYKDSFLAAVQEYNNYGLACADQKLKIEQNVAGLMYGFKAGRALRCLYVWCVLALDEGRESRNCISRWEQPLRFGSSSSSTCTATGLKLQAGSRAHRP